MRYPCKWRATGKEVVANSIKTATGSAVFLDGIQLLFDVKSVSFLDETASGAGRRGEAFRAGTLIN